MEEAIHRYALEQVLSRCLANSLKSTCEGAKLQPAAFIFIKNELFAGFFRGFC